MLVQGETWPTSRKVGNRLFIVSCGRLRWCGHFELNERTCMEAVEIRDMPHMAQLVYDLYSHSVAVIQAERTEREKELQVN